MTMPPPITIGTLLARIPGAVFRATDAVDVEHVIARFSADSRTIKPGDTFVAIPGTHHDASSWIDDAIARGAAVVVAPAHAPNNGTVAWLVTPDAFLSLAIIAAAFHGDPARTVKVLATTGTNGKIITSFLL